MTVIQGFRIEFLKYKQLAEKAVGQLEPAQLSTPPPGGGNSIATICWHVSGNLRSRFTDFLTSDGEKPWRHRDEEFEDRQVSREELLAKVLGTMQAPVTKFVQTLNEVPSKFVRTLAALRDQKEKAAA